MTKIGRKTLIELNGQMKPLADWAKSIGVHPETLKYRIAVLGWTMSDALTKPPQTKTRNYAKAEYDLWRGMITRCHNPRAKGFANYGEKGVVVCDRWRDSIDHFYSDMGNRPKGTTIDRIDNLGGYSPDNCRWATVLEQNSNRSISRLYTMNDRTQTAGAWARELGISYSALHWRLFKLGLSFEKAISIPFVRESRAQRFAA